MSRPAHRGRLADGRLGWAVEATGDPAILAQRQAYLDRLAERWHGQRIVDCLPQTEQALWQLSRNANSRLVLGNLLLAYPLPN